MTRTYRTTLILVAFLVASTAAYADLNFESCLTGDQEVPGVISATTGDIEVEFDCGLTQAEFRLNVFGGVGVTQAHFHCGKAGINGPVVAFLYGFGPVVDVDGLLSEGVLTNADFTGADCVPVVGSPVNNIASLHAAMLNGLIYANVHTEANPPGEVRGQIRKTKDDDEDEDEDEDDDIDEGNH